MIKLLKTPPALAAASILIAAPLAMAASPQSTGENNGYTGNTAAMQSHRTTPSSTSTAATAHEQAWQKASAPPKADIHPFEQAKLSLTEAINTAKREHEGKTLEARFEMWHGKPAYFIRTLSKDQVWEGRIDANTGQLIGKPRTISASQLHTALKRDASAAKSAQTSLVDAIDKAEQQHGAKAISARIAPNSHGGTAYDLDMVKNGQLHTAMVNASNGQLR